MWWHNGVGWAGWVVMALTMVAFWSLAVFAVAAIFRSDQQSLRDQAPPEPDPKLILDERFARGEIDFDEYRVRQAALGATH